MGRNVDGAKCPWGKISQANCPRAKYPKANCPGAKYPSSLVLLYLLPFKDDLHHYTFVVKTKKPCKTEVAQYCRKRLCPIDKSYFFFPGPKIKHRRMVL